MTIRAIFTGNSGSGMVNKPTHKSRRVMAIATVRRGCSGYMIRNLTSGTQSIMTGFTRDGVSRQHTMIEYSAHVESGGVMAEITGLRNVTCIRMRVWC